MVSWPGPALPRPAAPPGSTAARGSSWVLLTRAHLPHTSSLTFSVFCPVSEETRGAFPFPWPVLTPAEEAVFQLPCWIPLPASYFPVPLLRIPSAVIGLVVYCLCHLNPIPVGHCFIFQCLSSS